MNRTETWKALIETDLDSPYCRGHSHHIVKANNSIELEMLLKHKLEELKKVGLKVLSVHIRKEVYVYEDLFFTEKELRTWYCRNLK